MMGRGSHTGALPVRPAHVVHPIRQHDPAAARLLAQRRVTAIDRPVKDRILAVLAPCMAPARKGNGPGRAA
jgi:hypothetical protein